MYTCKQTIIGLCGATLIVSIAYFATVAALHYRNGDDHNNSVHYVNQSQKAIIDLCQNTYYHQTCINTLSKATNNSDSKTLIAASFHTAIHELGHVIAQTRTLQEAANDPKTAGAYKTCQKLLDDSIYDLQATIDKITWFDPSDFRLLIDDIKTWLTGALTYQETCLDCFEEVDNNEAGEKMEKLLKLSRELTINGLALVNEFSYFLVPDGLGGARRLFVAHTEKLKDYDYDYGGNKLKKGQQSTRNLLQAHQDHTDYDYGNEGSLKKGKTSKGQQSTRNLLQAHQDHYDYDYGNEGSLKKGKTSKGQQSTRNLLQAHQDPYDYDYGNEGSLKKGKTSKGKQSTRNLLQAHQGHIDDYVYDYDYKGSLIKKRKSTKSQQSTRNLLQAHQDHTDYDYGYEGSLKKGKTSKGQQSTRNLLQAHQDPYDYDYGNEGSLKKGKTSKGQQSTRNLLQADQVHIDDYVYDYDHKGSLIKKGKSKKGQQSTRNLLQAGPASISPNVVVAKDGSGKYTTINEALLEVPQKSHETFVIYIKEGVYQEYVTVNRTSQSVMFIGDGPTKTKVIGDRSKIGGYDTFWTSTVAIEGDNFIARDMGFENNAGPGMHQAVAVRVSSDKTIFHNCQMDGFQDTLYAHNHRQYYRDCTISGTIDFIFGNARAVFQNCTFVVRKPLESQKHCMVTAQGRTLVNQTSALVLQNCRIVAGPDYPVGDKSYEAFLGRPWKQFSRAIVMDSEIDGLINPGGWSSWNGTDAHLDTCWYAEAGNMGAGADLSRRVKWPGFKRLSIEEAETFTPEEYMMGDEWIAGKGVPYDSGRRRPVQLQ